MDNTSLPVNFSQRVISWLIISTLVWQPMAPAVAAAISPTGPASMDKAANGVPVLNIATPNGAGISHNQFKDYNVGKEGLILNNATGQLNQTQLGGIIQNNPNLRAGQEARGIINEVTGGSRSQLQGYTEVAGKAANVIVANPYGITCSGCGFINTPNATLTTGKPQFDDKGNLSALNVTGGTITVEGKGLDASNSSALSLISRATEVNAAIHAKDLKVIAGANRVGADGSVSAIEGDGPAPTVAVDTGALGGMYASRIHLVSSEKGVGVNLGNLNARQGDIQLDASGKLVLKDTLAGGALTAKGDDVVLAGSHKAGADIRIDSGKDIALNNATLASDGSLTLKGQAGLSVKDSALTSGADMALSANTMRVDAGSRVNASGGLRLDTTDLANRGTVISGGTTGIVADTLSNGGSIAASEELNATAKTVKNSGTLQGKRLDIESDDTDNTGTLAAKDTLALHTGTLKTGADSLITGEGKVALNARESADLDGKINAEGDLDVRSGALQTRRDAQLQSTGNIHLTADTATLGGTHAAKGALNASAQTLSHEGKSSASNIAFVAPGSVTNGGTLVADTLSLRGQKVVNSGLIQGNKAVDLQTSSLDNLAGGTLYSAGNLTLDIPDVTNGGQIAVDGDLRLSGSSLSNGGLVSAARLGLEYGKITNEGTLQSRDALTATADTLLNQKDGVLLSNGVLTLENQRLENAGYLQGDTLNVAAGEWLNTGNVLAENSLTATVNGTLTGEGKIISRQALALQADRIHNSGTLMAKVLALHGDLYNSGLLQGSDRLTLNSRHLLNGSTGKVYSGSGLDLDLERLENQGQLWVDGDLTLTGETLTNNGTLKAQALDANLSEGLDNQGFLLADNAVRLRSAGLTNSGNMAGNSLDLGAAAILNSGLLQGTQGVKATAEQITNAAAGTWLSCGELALNAGQLTTAGTLQGNLVNVSADDWILAGSLLSKGDLTTRIGNTLNLSGLLISQGETDIRAQTVKNDGQILSAGNAILSGQTLVNNGTLQGKTLTAHQSTIANSGSLIGFDGLTLDGQPAPAARLFGMARLAMATPGLELTNTGTGKLLTQGAIDIDAASVDNQGQLQAGTLTLAAGALSNQQGAEIVSSGKVRLTTPILLNSGLIQGDGETRIDATTEARNDGKMLFRDSLTLTTPDYAGEGWLQATSLLLNAAHNGSSGTLVADEVTLTGDTLDNQGTTQANQLTLNYRNINNGGSLIGNDRLAMTAGQFEQLADGKVMSGGDLSVDATGINALGQMVALGNLTLQLTDALTGQARYAAGKNLSVTSGGAIENLGEMQGQAVSLQAGGALTNGGKITTGSGDSRLSGSEIVLSDGSSLQGGGDLTLASGGNITSHGFAGTLGNMTFSTPGNIVNTALLYAAKNLALYSGSLKNQRGEILADNNLVIQRDASGNASDEVVNASGTIETRNGDITIKTAHLLNTREGLTTTSSTENNPQNIAGLGSTRIAVQVSTLPTDSYGIGVATLSDKCTRTGGGGSGNAGGDERCTSRSPVSYYAPLNAFKVKDFALSETLTTVTATGGSALIQAGNNMVLSAGHLENQASNIVARNDISLSGTTLENQSWQNARTTNNLTYTFVRPYISGSNGWSDPATSIKDLKRISLYPTSANINFELTGKNTKTELGDIYRSVIQAGGNVTASFSSDISNTLTAANAGGLSGTIAAPTLNAPGSQTINDGVAKQTLADQPVALRDQMQDALRQINGGLDGNGPVGGGQQDGSPLQDGGITKRDAGQPVDTSAYPLPEGNGGYFVVTDNPKSPYLITVNPNLDGLGQLDPNLFGDLYKLTGIAPSAAPRETNAQYTDVGNFLGSAYMLGRLNINPENDYRFLGDAAFDTRYVTNAVLNQTGNRYLNGVGSELEQMRYLMDSAASAQTSLGLEFGVSLNADQIASLDHSILWWESATVNGETVMIPKLYLSPKDVSVNNGSVIAGNNVSINGGNVSSDGGTLLAKNAMAIDSAGEINNTNSALIKAGGDLALRAAGDINNISAAIAGKTVDLESVGGSITNLTLAEQFSLDAPGRYGSVSLKDTLTGRTATISAAEDLSLVAAKDITLTGASLKAGGDLLMDAKGDIAANAIETHKAYAQSGFWHRTATSRSDVGQVGSSIEAGEGLAMLAGKDLTLSASDVNAGQSAQLSAGQDLNLVAQQTSHSNRNGVSESHSTGVDRATVSAGDNLTLTAGRDLTSQAASLGAGENVGIQAGRDVSLLAEETTSGNSSREKKHTVVNEHVRQQGTEITSGGNTVIVAGHDVNSQATQVLAEKDIGIAAQNDINLLTATESDYRFEEKTETKKGFLKKKTTHTVEEHSSTNELATLLSGDNVSLQAGNDLLVRGSAVAADGDIALKAGGDVTIDAATERASDYSMKKTTKSGFFGNGLGFTIGSQSAQETRRGAKVTQSDSRSVIGTTAGNIIIEAGDKATLVAANMVAGRDAEDTTRKTGHIDVKANDIDIVAGKDVVTGSVEQKTKSSGFGVSLSNPVIDTVRNIRDIAKTSGGSNVTQAKVIAGEAAASAFDILDGAMKIALPFTYGQSSSKSEMHYAGEYAVGSTLSSGGNVQLTATGSKGNGDVLINGSNIGAKEAAIIDAQRNVDITASTDKEATSSESSSKNWSVTTAMPTIGSAIRTVSGGPNNGSSILPFGFGKANGKEYSETTAQTGSQITAEDVYINSKDGHVNVSGSSLAAINDLMLTAKNGEITVDTGNNHVVKETSGSQTQIGTLGGDGYSGTVGWSRDKYASQLDQNQQSTLRSQIASRDGDVTLAAGKDVAIDGADISAGKSVSISGENVRLDVSEDTLKSHSESSNTQYGVKASASGWVVSAAQAVENAARSVEEDRDPRLSAIYAAQAGLNIATQTMQSDMNPSAVKVTVSATAGSSKQEQDFSSQQQQGTTIKAGESVNISADKDITGAGVNIAGKNVNLDAGRDIILATAQDKEALKNSASGNQFSVGVGVGFGGSQNGFSIELGASTYSNKENGDGLVHHNSQIVADETLKVNSGRDTTLKGTELKGDKVAVDVGRNLTIASLQDEQNYESKNKSGGVNVSICVPPICAGSTVSGTANAAGGKITNEYKSVIDQSGIYAGQGGFDVHVGEHTQLDGAVIASDATADKNRLDTGTLGWTDIENKAKSGGSQYAVSVSGGVGQNEDGGLKPIASGLPTASLASVSDSDSSTTRSAVADGEIVIRDKDKQQQDIAELSRDTENAHRALENNFDKDKIRDQLEIQTQAVALGTQAMDAWRTSKLDDEKAKIRAEMEANGELKGLSDAQINAKIEQSDQYKKVDEKYGVGSEFWRNGTAITGLLAGVLGGNVSGGMAAGAAPYVAALIKEVTKGSNVARVALHTLASAALVKAQGGNAAAGAAGGFIAASSSEALSQAFYGKSADKLSPEEKTVISNLVTALGAAGGSVAGGSSQGIGSGANAARVEVENNSLSGKDAQEKNSIELALSKTGLALHPRTAEEVAELEARRDQIKQLDAAIDQYVKDACSQGKASAACLEANALVQGLQQSYDDSLGKLTFKELNREDYAKVSQIVANTTADKWDYAIENYAKEKHISYQEAKNRFAQVININQAADIIGIIYSLKGDGSGTVAISSSVASAYKQVLSKYNEFKQNIMASTKGNNDALAMAGAGNVNIPSSGSNLPPNVNLSTGAGGKGNVPLQSDKLATQAQEDLIAEINKFPSKTQATNTSTMIGAYDPVTGKTAVGSSNGAITADTLHPTTVAFIEKRLGVKIGEFTSFCKNKAGACAEVSGADALIRQGSNPENIKFTQALRPREVWGKDTILPKAIIETCENCGTVWPNGAHK